MDGAGVKASIQPRSFIMAYVITDACIKDFVCAAECATAAIAPASAGDTVAAGVS